MGFSPLEGVPMATRSGSVDPGALVHVLREHDVSVEELDRVLEHESGLAALGGLENPLGFAVYTYRVAQAAAAMAAALGGIDALVFTGGVGENAAAVRSGAAERLAFLGVALDREANAGAAGDADVSARGADVGSAVVAAREDLEMARQARAVLGA
jgi:acetate kinase